jgi:NTE family protein
MHDQFDPSHLARLLVSVGAFGNLSAAELAELAGKLDVIAVARGEILVREGEQSDALYLVLSGRFEVFRRDGGPFAEIGAGHPIGEIAFFAGGPRTASVRAGRDCLVLKLGRKDFEELAARTPGLWGRIAAMLAQRLAEVRRAAPPRKHLPRTIAILRAGAGPVPDEFIRDLRGVLGERYRAIFLDSAAAQAAGHHRRLESVEDTSWFNELEARYDYAVYVADADLTDWSRKCIRQADLVLSIGRHGEPGALGAGPNELESFAGGLDASGDHRLVLLHEARGTISGTRRWLDPRPDVRMHYHVVRGDRDDCLRLLRFIDGSALGLVACGGGAFTAAHLGLYQALGEAGLSFDMMGGTSGGAAMIAAFATGADLDAIDRELEAIFVKGRVLRRWTWPRYGLLDHTRFDRALERWFGGIDIEDLWTPYFAVSTNLSTNALYCHRRGPLWQAVRATASLPALLPPFFTDRGDMLVDGALLDNVPTGTMRSFKAGPNVVISFEVKAQGSFDVDYAALPSRRRLLWCALDPVARKRLPRAPGPLSVLLRGLTVSRRDFALAMEEGDLLLSPPLAAEMGFMNWRNHSLLRRQGYAYGVAEIARCRANGHPLLAAKAPAE